MKTTTIEYLPDGHERHSLDVYLPEEPTGAPVVLVIHGGGLVALNKERMAGVSRRLTEDGYCAVTPNYRLLHHAPFPAQIEDILSVVAWIDSEPAVLEGADVSRLGILGASAGSYLGLLLSAKLTRERVSCLASISGPHSRRMMDGEGRADNLLDLITDAFPPTLHTHSTKDEVVPVEHARELREALEATGYPHEVFIYDHRPETDHAIWVPGTTPPVFLDFLETKIHSFLALHLKNVAQRSH